MLGTEADAIAFNLYRSTGPGKAVKLNNQPITDVTNFVDEKAALAKSNSYFIRPVSNQREQEASKAFTLPAHAPVGQYLSLPLQTPQGYASSSPSPNPKLPTLFVIGDSTANNNANGGRGWGDPFVNYFDASKINVLNRARAGRSSRTFITEGLWDKALADMKPDDFVVDPVRPQRRRGD